MLSGEQNKELLTGAYGLAREGVLLKELTTFKLGGPCDLLLEPTCCKEVIRAVRYLRAKKIPFYVIGNGSNLLVRDGGIEGVVLKLGSKFSDIIIDGNIVRAQSGLALKKAATYSFKAGLSGMEALSGIPGTLGGAAIMNAGAYGSEMKDVIKSVKVIDKNGEILDLSADDMLMGYRTSRMMQEGMIILEVVMELEQGDPEKIEEAYQDFLNRRKSKQPLDKASAGSTFKRPEGYFAGKLIEDAGLRGFRMGRVQVSEKHCGFVINDSGADASEVLDLIRYIQKTVWDKFRVELEPEIRIIGRDK